MLYMPKTKVEFADSMDIVAAQPSIFEGQLLKAVVENGVGKVTVGTAAGSEVIAGIAYKYFRQPTSAKNVESFTVPAGGGSVTLQFTPVSPSTASSVYDNTAAAALTYNGSVGSGQYAVSGAVVTFNAAEAGHTVTIIYSYNLTVLQAQLMFGDNHYIATVEASNAVSKIGVIKRGHVWTDQYDPAINWFASPRGNMTMGANGTITVGGSGPVIPGYLLEAPSVDFPYLGIAINVAA